MMEEYDAPELLYVSIQQALQDGPKDRRADVIKALQVSAIRLAGNIDSVIPVPKTDPAYPCFSRPSSWKSETSRKHGSKPSRS